MPPVPKDIPAYQLFAAEMGPILWNEIIEQNVKNPKLAFKNMINQLGYESQYGTTRLAKEQNNYGGVGFNDTTGTYFSYKDKKDFAKKYVKLMNSRYKNAIQAKNLTDYAKEIRKLGYYTDTLENYSNNLNGMKSFQKAVADHMAANPQLYSEGIKIIKTKDGNKKITIDPAEYGFEGPKFEPTWTPAQSINTDYPLNDTTPKSISSWSGADAPNATPRIQDFQETQRKYKRDPYQEAIKDIQVRGKRKVGLPDPEKILADNMQDYIKNILNLPKPEDATPTFARFMIPNPFYS